MRPQLEFNRVLWKREKSLLTEDVSPAFGKKTSIALLPKNEYFRTKCVIKLDLFHDVIKPENRKPCWDSFERNPVISSSRAFIAPNQLVSSRKKVNLKSIRILPHEHSGTPFEFFSAKQRAKNRRFTQGAHDNKAAHLFYTGQR